MLAQIAIVSTAFLGLVVNIALAHQYNQIPEIVVDRGILMFQTSPADLQSVLGE